MSKVLPDLLTIEQAAPKLGMAPATIRKKISLKTFKCRFIKDGGIKFDPRDIENYLESRKVKQTA
jgi:predicted DNA-binding transcriptional regulator AlpA